MDKYEKHIWPNVQMNKCENCCYQSLELEVPTGYNYLRFNNYFYTSKIYSLNFYCHK